MQIQKRCVLFSIESEHLDVYFVFDIFIFTRFFSVTDVQNWLWTFVECFSKLTVFEMFKTTKFSQCEFEQLVRCELEYAILTIDMNTWVCMCTVRDFFYFRCGSSELLEKGRVGFSQWVISDSLFFYEFWKVKTSQGFTSYTEGDIYWE